MSLLLKRIARTRSPLALFSVLALLSCLPLAFQPGHAEAVKTQAVHHVARLIGIDGALIARPADAGPAALIGTLALQGVRWMWPTGSAAAPLAKERTSAARDGDARDGHAAPSRDVTRHTPTMPFYSFRAAAARPAEGRS